MTHAFHTGSAKSTVGKFRLRNSKLGICWVVWVGQCRACVCCCFQHTSHYFYLLHIVWSATRKWHTTYHTTEIEFSSFILNQFKLLNVALDLFKVIQPYRYEQICIETAEPLSSPYWIKRDKKGTTYCNAITCNVKYDIDHLSLTVLFQHGIVFSASFDYCRNLWMDTSLIWYNID